MAARPVTFCARVRAGRAAKLVAQPNGHQIEWITFMTCLLPSTFSITLQQHPENTKSIFKKEHMIFSTDFNITKLLVTGHNNKLLIGDNSDMPSIFFTVVDPKLTSGSCIYVLDGFAAYELFEGGLDTTSDYDSDDVVYFGGKGGIYEYNSDTLTIKQFGTFIEDVIQLQKVNGSDIIYALNAERKLYKISNNGSIHDIVSAVSCASEFVLDTSSNIYYLSCIDNLTHIIKADTNLDIIASFLEDFKSIKLLRPAFIMYNCIPVFVHNRIYILYSNGSSERKDFYLEDEPSAYSVDAGLYLVAALNGKIYEYNVMEMLLKYMFGGVLSRWLGDLTNIIMTIIDHDKGSS